MKTEHDYIGVNFTIDDSGGLFAAKLNGISVVGTHSISRNECYIRTINWIDDMLVREEMPMKSGDVILKDGIHYMIQDCFKNYFVVVEGFGSDETNTLTPVGLDINNKINVVFCCLTRDDKEPKYIPKAVKYKLDDIVAVQFSAWKSDNDIEKFTYIKDVNVWVEDVE